MDEARWMAVETDAAYALDQLDWVGRRSRSAPADVVAALDRLRDATERIRGQARAELAAIRNSYLVPAGWETVGGGATVEDSVNDKLRQLSAAFESMKR